MSASTVTQVVDAVIEAIPESDDYVVVDGANGATEETEMILIGFSFDEDTPQISVDIDENPGLGGCQEQETISIDNVIISWSNDEDMKVHRDNVIDMYKTVRVALKQDVTLGGVCMRNRVSGYRVAQAQFPQGYGCYLDFNIIVESFAKFGS